uniref:Uncharacterized protein n=1 Tax=Anguilla anguilla TaxID=7936 RepID=A0A0E9TSS5_ANGAN
MDGFSICMEIETFLYQVKKN